MAKAKNRWQVLTGGPSTGKSTVLQELQKRGYKTVPEAARQVIDEAAARGIDARSLRADEEKFQLDVFKAKQANEAGLSSQELIFLDRGMHDTAAYLQAFGFPVPAWVNADIGKSTYQTVFLFEPLNKFTRDYARTEDNDFTIKLTGLLAQAYSSAGIKVINVPAMPVKDRVKLIVSHLR